MLTEGKQGFQTVHLFYKISYETPESSLAAALKEQWRRGLRGTEQVGTTVRHAEMK